MASSGTVSLNIDFKLRPSDDRFRESVLIAGRARIKNIATIEAPDLELRTIKEFIATPYFTEATPTNVKGPLYLMGSVTVAGSLMNSVYIRTMKGSLNPTAGGVGTAHLGTITGGTAQLGFFAIGA